jgi:hypothetical protein
VNYFRKSQQVQQAAVDDDYTPLTEELIKIKVLDVPLRLMYFFCQF